MWSLLRSAAVWRHRVLWQAFGSNPKTWAWHMAAIRAVYGW